MRRFLTALAVAPLAGALAALALLCSLATAWTFWRIALAPQPAV
jgi:hypothetical protein